MSYLLLRPSICENESLSSWLHRLRTSNGLTRWDALFQGEAGCVPHVSDPDLHLTDHHYLALEQATGKCRELLKGYSLRAWAQYLVQEYSASGAQRWILRERCSTVSKAVQYAICPECLRKDKIPFYRTFWRFSIYPVCHIHQVKMVSLCPTCNDPITLSSARKAPLDICDRCKGSLIHNRDSSFLNKKRELCALIQLATNISSQSATSLPMRVAYAFHHFDGLCLILSLMNRRRFAEKFIGSAFPSTTKNGLRTVIADSYCIFDGRDCSTRIGLLVGALWLLEDWPNRFSSILFEAKILSSEIRSSQLTIPYWLDDTIRTYLYKPKYKTSSMEVVCAAKVAGKSSRRVTRVAVERILGVHDSKELDSLYRYVAFTEIDAIALLRRINLELETISTSRDARSSTLRDAVAILFCMAFGLSVKQICALNYQAAINLWKDYKEMNFQSWDSLLSSTHSALSKFGNKWLDSYITFVRPNFARSRPARNEFLLTRYGERYLGHGLQDRFVRLLRSSGYKHPERGFKVLNDLCSTIDVSIQIHQ